MGSCCSVSRHDGLARGTVPSCCDHRAGAVFSGGSSFVVMVQAADLRHFGDLPGFRGLHHTRLWAVPVQRQMGAPVVVLAEVAPQHAPRMVFAEHDDVVEALPPDPADQPFRVRILPGTLGCDDDLLDAHTPDALAEILSIDPVSASEQIAWRFAPWECVHDPLSRPLGGRVVLPQVFSTALGRAVSPTATGARSFRERQGV